jgi:hypothetical protein
MKFCVNQDCDRFFGARRHVWPHQGPAPDDARVAFHRTDLLNVFRIPAPKRNRVVPEPALRRHRPVGARRVAHSTR